MSIRDLIRRDKPALPATMNNPFALLRDEFNRLMDTFWTEWPVPSMFPMTSPSREGMVFAPRIELSEDEKMIEITAELPGMTEKDIEVVLSEDSRSLRIKGEKKFDEEKKDKNFYRFERAYGAFERTIPLPSTVDEKNIDATFKDGVLSLRLPKMPGEAQALKKIEVKGR